MTQTLLLVVLFVAAIGTLPWLVRKLQQRRSDISGLNAGSPRVISAIAVGPQQRVVTVEVGAQGERITLILGVTPQHIQCLHTVRDSPTELQRASFANEVERARASATPTNMRAD